MKKSLPWIIAGLFAAWIVATLRPPTQKDGFHSNAFGQLPVLLNGRVQPLDSVARNSLLVMRGKQTVLLDNRKSLPAIHWLLDAMMRPEIANDYKIFRVDHPELLGLLKLDPNEKYFSFNQLTNSWEELDKQAKRAGDLEAQTRTPFEKQLLKLHNGMGLYFRLKNSLQPEGEKDFAAELEFFKKSVGPGLEAVQKSQAGQEYDQQALQTMARFFRTFQVMANLGYPLAVPPAHPEHDRDGWSTAGQSLMESLRSGQVHPAVAHYAAMATAYRHGRPAEFNQAVDAQQQWLAQNLNRELKKGRSEFFYNHLQAFYKATVIYVFAFILVCISWFNWSEWMNRAAFRLIALGLLVHTAGLIFRMVLEGRPPVTNLYSSAIFVGWGAAVLGLILERIHRDGIGAVTAAMVGFISLIIAHNLSLDGDTMEMLRAVLDTNFWLATHVVMITLGYASVFVSGFLGVLYILRGVFSRSLTGQNARALNRMVYGIVCFSTLFSFLGTILGGIWADQSWGRFWGWDPKENGALIIVLWCAIILHARWGGLVKERGLMNMAVFGNIVTSFSWFGVNMLGVGLHSYGFMDQAFKWLLLFVVSQLAIIGFGLLPLRYWLSFKNLAPEPAKSPTAPALAKSKPLPA